MLVLVRSASVVSRGDGGGGSVGRTEWPTTGYYVLSLLLWRAPLSLHALP